MKATGLHYYEAVNDGVFDLETVFKNHEKAAEKNPIHDGILFNVRVGNREMIQEQLLNFQAAYKLLDEWIKKTPYLVYQVLRSEQYYYLCRIQLMSLFLEEN